MASSIHCPNCNSRIHPLTLSDLHLGRKRDCHFCGWRLQATAGGGAATLAAFGALLLPILDSFLPGSGSTVGAAVLAAVILGILLLAPPGLIAGARWVRIVATPPETAVVGPARTRPGLPGNRLQGNRRPRAQSTR